MAENWNECWEECFTGGAGDYEAALEAIFHEGSWDRAFTGKNFNSYIYGSPESDMYEKGFNYGTDHTPS